MNRHGLYTPTGGPALPEFRIGLAPVPVEQWFEGGEADPAMRKDALYRDHPTLVWGEVAGSRLAQGEVAAMIEDWLDHNNRSSPRKRGPRFESEHDQNQKSLGPRLRGDERNGEGMATLHSAARLVPDDLCLMERRDGQWTLTAASLCAPSFFSAKEAVGKPLAGLHAPVPGFHDALLPRVARIFDNLQTDQVLERRNWTVVNDPELFQPDPTPFRARLPGQTPEEIAASLFVRRERQTIRRAPETGAVLFTIRIWRERLDDLLADPDRRAGFAAAWETLMGDDGAPFRTYKRLELYDAAVRWRLAGLG